MLAEADRLECRHGARSRVIRVDATDGQPELHVLACRQERDEVAHLVDDPDVRGPQAPRPSRSSVERSLPRVTTRPSVGRSRPDTRRSNVDLPLPDGPVTT